MGAKPTPATDQSPDRSSSCLAIIEHAPQPMALLEGASHIVRDVNPAFCRVIGKKREELIGQPFAEIMPEKEGSLRLLDRVFHTEEPETHTEQAGSEPHPVYWRYTIWPVRMEGRTAGVMIQVTETAQFHQQSVAMSEALMLGSVRQHELTEAAEQLSIRLQAQAAERARLLDLSNDAIVVHDVDGRIVYWNHGAEEIYGWSREEALGKDLHALLQTEFPKPFEQINQELRQHNRWTGELVHTKRDGQRITVLARKALDRDPQGNPVAVLETSTDITERKQAEERLEQVVAARTAELRATNEQLETFVYSIAHDLRAPLRSITGFSQLLADDHASGLSASAQQMLKRIRASSEFMDRLLLDLLAFGRTARAEVELGPVEVRKAWDVALFQCATELEKTHAHIETSAPLPTVRAHEATLGQCLANLLSNAVKFVPPGTQPRIRFWTEDCGNYIRLFVEDNGIGIPAEQHERVFRVFERLQGARYAGTGIGLSIVRKGAERMGGKVGLQSEPGKGSRFWIELAK